ncbi:MAG: hypothetical protein EOP90_12020 [Lysobacteraceae bacterium]|nr:MAG: hypothetical protein EOP90_12020 [Xanthomonadaceae bacterium]
MTPALTTHRRATAVAAVLIALVIAAAYWPGLAGDWGRDDYFQLAFARLLDSPWPLFVRDHFPVPGSVFRPLGVASMWLGAALFGSDYTAHAASDLALHVAVALALLAWLVRSGLAVVPAALASLLFGLHPLAIGTALWWSARFDLLATLFGLLALWAATRHRECPRTLMLACTVAASLAALLSKETGVAVVAAVIVLWSQRTASVRAWRATGVRGVAWLIACVLAWFAWRAAVLGTATTGLTGSTALATTFVHGTLEGLRNAAGFFSYWPRLALPTRLASLAGVLVLAFAILMRVRAGGPARRDTGWIACASCLVLVPMLLQAPVAALNAAPLSASESAVQSAMQSRLYYLGLVGLAALGGALLDWIWRARANHARVLALGAAVPLLAAWAVASHVQADSFARRSVEIARVAHAASERVAALDLRSEHCHVIVHGLGQPPEWGGYVSVDSVLKALAPEPGRIAHCWFHGGQPTWFHLLAAPVDDRDAKPFEPLTLDGVRLPWREVGGVVIAYLDARQPIDDAMLQQMRVLRLDDARVVEPAPTPVAGDAPAPARGEVPRR